MEIQKQTSTDSLRIKDCEIPAIKLALVYCFSILGISDKLIPNNERQLVLINFIKEYYPQLKMGDIKKAFDLLATGELQIDTSTYGHSFAPEYFGKVIRKWKEYDGRKNAPMNKTLPELPPVTSTGKQNYDAMIKHIETKKNFGYIWSWSSIFEYMEEMKLITDTIEEKKLFAERIKVTMQMEQATHKHNLDFDRAKSVLEAMSGDGFKARCRKERILIYLKTKYPAI